jgi:hypothetical protein
MQKENTIEKKGKILNLDLDTKKEIAKIGMTASLGIVTASSFYLKNRFMKNLHIGSGVALIGFSFWHHMLYQPNEKKSNLQVQLQKSSSEETLPSAISIGSIYTEVKIRGKLTKEDVKNFELKLELLLKNHNVESINTLIDIKEVTDIEFLAIWNDFIFLLKHYKIIDKVAVVGKKPLKNLSVKITNKLVPASMQYFATCKDAKSWLLEDSSF